MFVWHENSTPGAGIWGGVCDSCPSPIPGGGWWQSCASVPDTVSLLTSLALAGGVCSWQGGAWSLGNVLAVCLAETWLGRVQ